MLKFVFFFKQKTAYELRISDCSSDVCSSDLNGDSGDSRSRAGIQGRGSQPSRRPSPRASGLYDSLDTCASLAGTRGDLVVLLLNGGARKVQQLVAESGRAHV